MAPERVRLNSIKALTFYANEYTAARRSQPIPQLTCVGKPCSLYQPDAVQCVNVGGQDTDVNWKCEADLPESLRFGRINVSCEGWASSGDSYVLKGSCGLKYRLVQVPNYKSQNYERKARTSWFSNYGFVDYLYAAVWLSILGWMLYSFLAPFVRPWLRSSRGRTPGSNTNRRPPGGGGGGYGSGSGRDNWGSFGGNRPPPPYSKNPQSNPQASERWNPGFWTGLGVGGAATYLANSYMNRNQDQPLRAERQYDWEGTRFQAPQPSSPPRPRYQAMGQGEGTSSGGGDLGPTRRATGVGGSTVR